jgi:hypothetical protein
MSSFWRNAYSDEKDRRYGTLFFVTLLVVLGTVVLFGALGANLSSYQLQDICIVALPVVILTIILLCWRWIHVERKNRSERQKYASLSRDELAKARSKLKSQMKPVVKLGKQMKFGEKRPAHRPPDTDLKY